MIRVIQAFAFWASQVTLSDDHSMSLGCTIKRWRRGLKNVWKGDRKLQFLTESYKFPTKEIMGAQNFTFAPSSPKIGDFQAHILYLWKKFSNKKKIFRHAKNLGGWAIAPATTPLIRN